MNKNECNHPFAHFWLNNSALLTIAVGRSEYYRIKYLQAIEREPTLERVRVFFRRIQPLLKMVYPIVDILNKKRGRLTIVVTVNPLRNYYLVNIVTIKPLIVSLLF